MLKGNHMNSLRIAIVLLWIIGVSASANVWSAQAGLVQFVSGYVELVPVVGGAHAVHKGDPVNEGDTIISAKAASAQIKMLDGGFVAVRPDTQLKFDSFKFGATKGEPESAFFSLLKGGFRAITGLIGSVKKEDYRITTPAATIGIRGTDHETVVVLPDNPLVLSGQAAPGTYNKVNVGVTIITTERGSLNVLPNQMGFAGGPNQMPKIQPVNASLFTVAPPASPKAKMENDKGGDKASSGAKTDSDKEGDQSMRSTAAGDDAPQSPPANTTSNSTSVFGATGQFGFTPSLVILDLTSLFPQVVPTSPFVNTDIVFNVVGNGLSNNNGGAGSPSSVFSLPNPTSFTANYKNDGGCSGCTLTSSVLTLSGGTPVSSSNTATGIKWGYWTGATVTKTDTPISGAPTVTTYTPGVTSWIVGPSSSFILPMVLSGVASYGLVGGVATNGASMGTINSASLSVNFTQQVVGLALDATVDGVNWVLSGSGASLGYGGQGNAGFSFSTTPNVSCTGCAQGTLTVSSTGQTVTSGYVSGALTGSGLTGAILSYALYGNYSNLFGVAALELTSSPINTAQPYQAVLSSMPMIPANLTAYATRSLVGDIADGAAFNPATFSSSSTGAFLPQVNSSMIDTLALGGITGSASATISGSSLINTGTDSVSGIKWGRWSGGNITFTALNGSGSYSMAMPAGGLSWIMPPASSGSISLPTSGTFNYVLAGYTAPTDQAGNVGTLNSASLSANFTAMTVNVAANVSIPAANVTFNSSATSVAIQNGMVFNANSGTTTCAGAGCGAVNAGSVLGIFTQGGVGAAVTYAMQTGSALGSPTTVVGGVAAFHR